MTMTGEGGESSSVVAVIKHKTPLKARTHSPGQLLFSPNNDDYEKAQARAARAAAIRRKSFVGLDGMEVDNGTRGRLSGGHDVLSKEQILELFQNCIKLATENKINQRNTWDLRLIDHLSEVINGDDQEDTETNFQKASCTLEAGVKIYSYRVDSVHSEAFKVLGGLNRTAIVDGGTDDGDSHEQDEGDPQEQENGKKDSQRKVAAASATLEASYDAINVKKFDVAFTVDPLFHQTSAQFDEGGARGLLLNTLSVYNGCSIVFDSNEVPIKSMKSGANFNTDPSALIDLSSMKDCIEQMTAIMHVETEITPTLKGIIQMLNDPYRAAAEAAATRHAEDAGTSSWIDDQISINGDDVIGEVCDANGDNFADDDVPGSYDTAMSPVSVSWGSNYPGQEDNEDTLISGEVRKDMSSEQTFNWIGAGLGLATRSNAWAGSDHWKYRRLHDNHQNSEHAVELIEKKKKRPKSEKFLLDFLKPPKIDMTTFAPPSDTRSLLLSHTNYAASTLLPEDCHYQAEDLVKLYLLPSIMCINQKGRKKSDVVKRRSSTLDRSMFGVQHDENEIGFFGDAENWNDENMHSDVEDPFDVNLVPQPRKVQNIEVNYDRMSRQIDVQVLKESLWKCLQERPSVEQDQEECPDSQGISFKALLSCLPGDCRVAAFQDISVHLCFICLLHLANEHNLSIKGCSDLNELYISNIQTDGSTSSEITS
eukprot:c47091_g1_i1 orf=213-2336(+)